MFCPYFIVGVDLGVRAAYQLRLARPIVWGCTCALFLCEIIWVDLIYIFFGAADNVLVYTILLIISVRRPVFNQLVGTGYLIIKRLAFIDLSYRSLSDEFFITIRFTKI